MPRVPAYCDAFVQAFRHGLCGDHLHLGLWDDPPSLDTPALDGEFEAAQDRLTQNLIGRLDLLPTMSILDIACGLGGTLREINQTCHDVDLVGLNLDPNQIALARRLSARPGNHMRWLVGDAGRLPLRDQIFDAALCVEAMFHFASRALFLREVSRILKPGGAFVLSDILLVAPNPTFRFTPAQIETTLQGDYGPWPNLWSTKAEILAEADACGLTCLDWVDVSQQTLPSYRTIAPRAPVSSSLNGAQMMRTLHEKGLLHYVVVSFRKSLTLRGTPA